MEQEVKVCWKCGAMSHRVKGIALDRKRERLKVVVNGRFIGRYDTMTDALEANRQARLSAR